MEIIGDPDKNNLSGIMSKESLEVGLRKGEKKRKKNTVYLFKDFLYQRPDNWGSS